MSAEGFEHERQWSRDFRSALEPHHTSVYVNFLMDEGEGGSARPPRAEVPPAQGLKRRYDPDSFFRVNQNIPPG